MFRQYTGARRALQGISLAGVAALALTACGPAVSGDTAADATPATDFGGVEPATEISFWSNHPGGSIDIEKELIAAFEAESGITVNLVTAGANYEEVAQKFQTAQSAGEVGDVVVLSDATWFPAYLNGSIIPVDEVLASVDADTSTYVETLFNDYLYEGDHYGVPYARSTPIFYYNKDAYAAAGLPDEVPATWDEVKTAAAQLATANPGASPFVYPAGASYPAWTLSNLVWGYDGGWSDEWDFAAVSSQQTVDALTFAQSSVKDGWASVSSGDQATDFASGAALQTVASTGSLAGILEAATFEVGVGFLPGGPAATEGVVPTGGAGVAIASKSSPEKQAAAALFIDFLTNAESTATFSGGTGYLPVRTDADLSAIYAETPAFEVAVEQLANTRSQDFARVLLPGGDLALSGAVTDILTSDVDVAETLTALETQLQALYDRDLASQLG